MTALLTDGRGVGPGGGGSPTVRARGVEKRYGDVVALRGVDLDVAAGEVVAVVGPNGAGKTTTVEILLGLRHRSGGDVTVLGMDPERADPAWRARIGAVLQSTAVEPLVRPIEALSFQAGLYPSPASPAELLARVGLDDIGNTRWGALSGGQQRRVDVALALVGRPSLLFLDEPTTGLDPEARQAMWQVVDDLRADGAALVLTTHALDEAERLADRIAVVARGRVVAQGTPAELGGRHREPARVTFELTEEKASRLPALPGEQARTIEGTRVTLTAEAPLPLLAALHAHHPDGVHHLEVRQPSLLDVYLDLVKQ